MLGLLLLACHWISDEDLAARGGGTDTGCRLIDGWLDLDRDGHGDPDAPTTGCAGAALVETSDDCDDSDAGVSPSAQEIWYDGTDQDCDSNDDDADGDGFGLDDDCDDTDPSAWPGAPEVWHDARVQDCDAPHRVDLAGAPIKLRGAEAYDATGRIVALPGELTGDGAADLAVGTPFLAVGARNPGGVYVVSGPAEGVSDLASASTLLLGDSDFDQFGGAVAGGDFDGDGQPDLAVGALNESSAGEAAGAAYVFTGPLPGGATHYAADIAHTRLLGAEAGDWAGWAVASAGPVTSSGVDDLLVGALLGGEGSGTVKDSGAAFLIHRPGGGAKGLGGATATFRGESLQDYVGTAVSGAGDLDGDGLHDVLIGATGTDHTGTTAGSVYVFRGPLAGQQSLGDAIARLDGPGPSAFCGGALAPVGDVNGDGHDDVLIGATGYSDGPDQPGGAFLVLGPLASGGWIDTAAEAVFIGLDDGDAAGHSVATAGDVDGDGQPELVIGAPGHADSGAAHLVHGPASGFVDLADATLMLGEDPDDELGYHLAGGADLTGEGDLDLVLGAPGHDPGFGRTGAVYVLTGGG